MTSLEKFQSLLKDIFQFEASDLDFGIYRILNLKRRQIQEFIEKILPQKIEEAFQKYKEKELSEINKELESKRKELIEKLGKDALTPTDEVKEGFRNTPIAGEYLKVKRKKEEIEKVEEIQNQIFIDLYNFFSRYYEEGDFVPQYRYSIKKHKYAIPYSGEEVTLYWANKDQYYTKTGLLFRDYTFKANNHKVIFRITEAKEELGSNKATKDRFFILDDENPVEQTKDSLIIRFQYRELVEKELEEIKKFRENKVDGEKIKPKQEEIDKISYQKILKKIKDQTLKLLLSKDYIYRQDKEPKPYLLYHLNRFTAKNTRDYFIHKNLKKFLNEQLDYFIKSEVLNIETLSEEKFFDKHIARAKIVKEIGEKIIDFLSQIEDFQKKLWEKKKFVLQTHYVITLDKISQYAGEKFLEEILNEILKNKEQLKEWKELGFGEIKSKRDLISKEDLLQKEYKKLPIDTKYFSQEFKEKLLEKLSENADLDDILNGLLIKSENWQALNLILEKYKEKVQTIYIDPPFNKEQDADYLYNVKYKDSTWASMLENRLRLARDLLSDKGSIFVRCDYNGNWIVRPLMDEVFGKENFRNEIILQRGMQTRKAEKRMLNKTDSLFFYFKNLERGCLNILEREKEHVKCFNETLKVLEKLDIPLHVFEEIKNKLNETLWMPFLSMPGEQKSESYREIFGIKLYPPKGRHWAFTQENLNLAIKNKIARLVCKRCENIVTDESHIRNGKCKKCNGEEFEGQIYSLYNQINDNWTDIPGYEQDPDFPTKNSEILLKRVIESTSNEGDLVMDFFLGSGTTTAVAHKLKRKWIGIEMGEHFWTVVLPRMKKVLFYDKSGISKEKDVKEKYNEKTAGGFFKYQILEQYEDTLDNIELKENQKAQELFKDEYLLKYFLDFETRESPYLLNIEHLKNPFSYKLKVNLQEVGEPKEMLVDIPETFNYLLGLKIRKIKARKKNERKYLFILGEKEGRNYAIVWREYSDDWQEKDFKEDKEFVLKELESWNPQVVYVNGQSVITPKNFEVRYIEPEFKKLMES